MEDVVFVEIRFLIKTVKAKIREVLEYMINFFSTQMKKENWNFLTTIVFIIQFQISSLIKMLSNIISLDGLWRDELFNVTAKKS
jgi:hypothetical protein